MLNILLRSQCLGKQLLKHFKIREGRSPQDLRWHLDIEGSNQVCNGELVSVWVYIRAIGMLTLVPQVVQNHDTQPGQTVETPIEGECNFDAIRLHIARTAIGIMFMELTTDPYLTGFFKPLAHALILLRVDGYPAVFYGDLYGTKGEHPEPPSCGGQLADIVLARTLYSYGKRLLLHLQNRMQCLLTPYGCIRRAKRLLQRSKLYWLGSPGNLG